MKNSLPVKKDVRLQQAVKTFGDGQYKMAEELLEEYLRQYPDDLAVLTQYAEIAEVCNNWMQAKERWKRVIEAVELAGEPLPKRAKRRLEKLESKQEIEQ